MICFVCLFGREADWRCDGHIFVMIAGQNVSFPVSKLEKISKG